MLDRTNLNYPKDLSNQKGQIRLIECLLNEPLMTLSEAKAIPLQRNRPVAF